MRFSVWVTSQAEIIGPKAHTAKGMGLPWIFVSYVRRLVPYAMGVKGPAAYRAFCASPKTQANLKNAKLLRESVIF